MSEDRGFIDLRVGHGAQGVGDDSVWPSFTDVMTVIVMIFLMALVVIMIRNFELDRALLVTIAERETAQSESAALAGDKSALESSLSQTRSERDALQQQLETELQRIARLAQDQERLEGQLGSLVTRRRELESSLSATRSERDTLQRRLETERQRIAQFSADNEQLEAELGTLLELRAELASANLKLRAENRDQSQEIERLLTSEQTLTERIDALSQKLSQLKLESGAEIVSLSQEKQTLGQKLDTVSAQLAQIRRLLDESEVENRDLSAEIANLTAQLAAAEQNYVIAEEEIQALQNLIALREAENAALQTDAGDTLASFRSLEEEYQALDEKYRQLIRAARSPAGKYVVEVRVQKRAAALVYQIRRPEEAQPRSVGLEALHQELAALKADKGQTLYTKIVIPENSNLTYDEGWQFTQTVLNQYDYYHQPQR